MRLLITDLLVNLFLFPQKYSFKTSKPSSFVVVVFILQEILTTGQWMWLPKRQYTLTVGTGNVFGLCLPVYCAITATKNTLLASN